MRNTPEMTSAALVSLRRARDLIDRDYSQRLDVAALAYEAGYSRHHFVRAFADAYGETPMRYLTRRRIERAQDLLRSANLTVTEISEMVGYRSLGSFTSQFTRLVAVSPTAYQRQWRTSAGALIPGCFLFMRGIDAWPPIEQSGRSSDDRRMRTVRS